MDLAKFIQNLQQKPEPTKKLILWLSTGVIMLIIGSGWIVSLQTGGVSRMNSQAQKQKNTLGSIVASFKKDMASLKNTIPTNTTQKPEKRSEQDEKTVNTNRNSSESQPEEKRQLYKLPLSK